MKLSVIIPVYNGAAHLGCVLRALAASDRLPDETLVVDNGSTDQSCDIARQHGATVLHTDGHQRGPAHARNLGAQMATGEVLVFIDADVAVHTDALRLIEQTLIDYPAIAGVFGSYDEAPPAPGLASQYKNLLHHYVHQHGHREAVTFWTGCGALRRESFLALGGFDERYTRPSIEDIDLGARLRRAGQRVWLCPEIQASHLKQWTLGSLLRSDVHDRAAPWTRLILREAYLPGDLNLDQRSRISAVLAWLGVGALMLSLWQTWLLIGALLAFGGLYALNTGLYRFFRHQGGKRFGLGALGLHLLYLLYSSLIFSLLTLGHAARAQSAHRWTLWALLAVTFIKGWVWSVVIPPWQASDEDQHFGYAQEVTRQRTWPIAPPQDTPLERTLLWELIDPNQLSGQREPLDLSPLGLEKINGLLRQLDDPAVRTTVVPPIWFSGFVRQHPPLYYTLEAVMHFLGTGQNILGRLALMRLFSVVLAVITVAFTYQAARVVWAGQVWQPLVVAVLVSFHPLFTFFTSVVSNAALEIACYSALTWIAAVIVRGGMTGRRGLMLGVIMTIGLLTKSSFLPAWLLVALLLGWTIWRSRRRTSWRGWAVAIGLSLALTSWWYLAFFTSGGGALIDVYTASPKPAVPVPLVAYLLNYPWLTRYLPFVREWWSSFGWRDTFFPPVVFTLLNGGLLAAVLGWGWLGLQRLRALRAKQTGGKHTGGYALTLVLALSLTLGLIAFYTALDYRLALVGKAFKIQGRYFIAPITAQMLALAAGWLALRRGRRWLGLAVCVGMIGLNTYALAGVIAPRYYGEQIVARYPPTDREVGLTGEENVARDLALTADQVSRIDVWLKPTTADSAVTATLQIETAGQAAVRVPIARPQMTASYPTVLRPDFVPQSPRLGLTLTGSNSTARLSADGQLAAKVYQPVPIAQWLDRIAVLQPAFYRTPILAGLLGVYVISLIGLIVRLYQARRATSDEAIEP